MREIRKGREKGNSGERGTEGQRLLAAAKIEETEKTWNRHTGE